MIFLPLKNFYQKYITPITRITNPRLTLSENLVLPKDAVIHYIADSAQITGIDSTDTLMRNAGTNVIIHHVDKLMVILGRVQHTSISLDIIKRAYHKSHIYMREAKNLERIAGTITLPIVINYSMLPLLNKYAANQLLVYQEWYNLRYTMWQTINSIGPGKNHFIKYVIPAVLPMRQHLLTYGKAFTAQGMNYFHTDEEFNILELWRMLNQDFDSIDTLLSEDVIEHVNLVFIESGHAVVLPLHELLTWSKLDQIQACNGLYRFLDYMTSLRTVVSLPNATKEENLVTDEALPEIKSKIADLIKEQGSVGALSASEQKSLLKLSQRYKSIFDPWGADITIDDITVEPTDLVLNPTALVTNSPITIHDPSMLYSTLKEVDAAYVDKVLHKDIIQSVLKIQDAGIIVKDVTVKRKNTAVSKTETISVQLQPIAGAASTIAFTIPVIEKDGTFQSGGVKYRLDKQHGDFKPCTM